MQEFGFIIGLCCGLVPSTHVVSSHHFRDKYFSGRKVPLHNSDIYDVFDPITCEDNDDMLRLALLLFSKTVVLSNEQSTLVPLKHIHMLDDLDYFMLYRWGTVSYHITVQLMRGCPIKGHNKSHTYTLTGFPLAFMISYYFLLLTFNVVQYYFFVHYIFNNE